MSVALPKPLISPPGTPPNPFGGLVSAVIPTFNSQSTLRACVESLRAQTYPNIEIIVSDDASPDGTLALAQSLGLACVSSVVNSGPAAARNAGARIANGEVFFFCEADGYYDPDYVEKLISHLHLPGVVGATNVGRKVWTEKTTALVRYQNALHDASARRILDGKRGTGAWAFDKDIFWKVGGFDPALRVGEDVELLRRLTAGGGRTVLGGRSTLHHKDPDTLETYLRRAHRGAVNSAEFRARERGPESAAARAAYVAKFCAVALTPVYLLLAALVHPAFALAFVAGAAYLVGEDATVWDAYVEGMKSGDVPLVLAAPCFLYLRRLAIGFGRIRSFRR